MTRNGPLVVTNNFLHDLATGTWFGVLIVMWRLHGLVGQPDFARLGAVVHLVHRELFWWGIFALSIIVLSGVIRTSTCEYAPVARDLRAIKLRLLVAKHVLLGAVFGFGTFLEYLLAFRP